MLWLLFIILRSSSQVSVLGGSAAPSTQFAFASGRPGTQTNAHCTVRAADAANAAATGQGKHESNGQRIFWSRGNGWVMGGLVQLLQELPASHPSRPFYVSLFKEMSGRLVQLQQADGLWRSSLLDPGAYPGGEASGSGFDCVTPWLGASTKVFWTGQPS